MEKQKEIERLKSLTYTDIYYEMEWLRNMKQTDEKRNPLTYWGGLKEPKQERSYSEEVLQIIKNAFNQGERYGWDSHKSIENIDEVKNKIPAISLEKIIEKFKNK